MDRQGRIDQGRPVLRSRDLAALHEPRRPVAVGAVRGRDRRAGEGGAADALGPQGWIDYVGEQATPSFSSDFGNRKARSDLFLGSWPEGAVAGSAEQPAYLSRLVVVIYARRFGRTPGHVTRCAGRVLKERPFPPFRGERERSPGRATAVDRVARVAPSITRTWLLPLLLGHLALPTTGRSRLHADTATVRTGAHTCLGIDLAETVDVGHVTNSSPTAPPTQSAPPRGWFPGREKPTDREGRWGRAGSATT